ncbi:MAG: hypothetical protein LIP12_16065 [Clostridiales bacterium]|nr:hypothetical protein [Clostridiales bacterium]
MAFFHAETDEVKYSLEFKKCLTELAHRLSDARDPKEIGINALMAACEFYDADWCGVLDVDVKMEYWMPLWWYDRKTAGMTETALAEQGVNGIFPNWKKALEENYPIIVTDMEDIRETRPEEYAICKEMRTRSLLAVPYCKRERGFMLLRNASRYKDKPEFLRILSYVLVSEINEQKRLDRMKLKASDNSAWKDADVEVNFFGGMEIRTAQGTLDEAALKSPLSGRLLFLLMMNRDRAMPARMIAEKLWPDVESDDPGGKVRALTYRFRKTFQLLAQDDEELLVTTSNGYRINPELKIRTDYEQFESIIREAAHLAFDSQKIVQLKKAIALYRGSLFPSGAAEHWQMGYASRYRMMYLDAVNDLLKMLYSEGDFKTLHDYAAMAENVEPGCPNIIFWTIKAFWKQGAVTIARHHLEAAKSLLLAEEYQVLEGLMAAG